VDKRLGEGAGVGVGELVGGEATAGVSGELGAAGAMEIGRTEDGAFRATGKVDGVEGRGAGLEAGGAGIALGSSEMGRATAGGSGEDVREATGGDADRGGALLTEASVRAAGSGASGATGLPGVVSSVIG
jgi:hypothetical protein